MKHLNDYSMRFGIFLRDHSKLLQYVQWIVVVFYLFLIIVPTVFPLPDETSSVFNHLTVFSQFIFWGVWWPFVLVSILIFGRIWCGWLCPEGTLTEWASRHGQHRAIPRWIRWPGWPFVTFACVTIYGQLISVYQYPLATLLILGGSTVAALGLGFFYGRGKRVWCRYLCPVSGVFDLLAKLSPWHYQVDVAAWHAFTNKTTSVNCAPLLPLKNMKSAGPCHMCGRCSGYRDAIALTARSMEVEIVKNNTGSSWQTALLTLGLMGIAVGAFLWSTSPWWVIAKQGVAQWFIEHEIWWPITKHGPWWLLTDYPEVHDSFSWLDGGVILGFIFTVALLVGGSAYLGLFVANHLLPKSNTLGLHQLAQGLIPLAGSGVFLGLSMTTVTLLKQEGWSMNWAQPLRFMLLSGATIWSMRLIWRLSTARSTHIGVLLMVLFLIFLSWVPFFLAWILLFVE